MESYLDTITSIATSREAQKRDAEKAKTEANKKAFALRMEVLGPIATVLGQLQKAKADGFRGRIPSVHMGSCYHRGNCLYAVYAACIYSAFNGSLEVSVGLDNEVILVQKAYNSDQIIVIVTFPTANEALPTVLSILADQTRHS